MIFCYFFIIGLFETMVMTFFIMGDKMRGVRKRTIFIIKSSV